VSRALFLLMKSIIAVFIISRLCALRVDPVYNRDIDNQQYEVKVQSVFVCGRGNAVTM